MTHLSCAKYVTPSVVMPCASSNWMPKATSSASHTTWKSTVRRTNARHASPLRAATILEPNAMSGRPDATTSHVSGRGGSCSSHVSQITPIAEGTSHARLMEAFTTERSAYVRRTRHDDARFDEPRFGPHDGPKWHLVRAAFVAHRLPRRGKRVLLCDRGRVVLVSASQCGDRRRGPSISAVRIHRGRRRRQWFRVAWSPAKRLRNAPHRARRGRYSQRPQARPRASRLRHVAGREVRTRLVSGSRTVRRARAHRRRRRRAAAASYAHRTGGPAVPGGPNVPTAVVGR